MNSAQALEERQGIQDRKEKRNRAYIFVVSLVVIGLSFTGGLLTNIWDQDAVLSINIVKPPDEQVPLILGESREKIGVNIQTANQNLIVPSAQATSEALETDTKQCLFVGSKNSNKYHSPSCSYAKRILPANRVCFTSAEEAQKKGYVPGCIK